MASLSVEILPSSTRSGRTIPVEPPIGVFGGGGYSELASAAGGLASRGEEALLVWRANGGVSGPLGAVWIDPERASSLALEIESELWRSPQVATDGQDYLVTGLAPAEAGALGVELRASRLAPGATSLDDPRGTKVAAGSLIYSHRIVALGPGRYVVVYLDFEAEDRQRLLLASVTTVGGVSGGEPVVLAEGALRSFAVAANRSTLLVVSSQALDEERFSIDSFAFPLPLR
jgi:hypothetical protein